MEKLKLSNWRALLAETGIIVLGVCIALLAQQAADWLHWQSEVKTARRAIYAEIASNNTNFSARRLAFAPCLGKQAAEAGKILDDLEAKRPPGRFTVFRFGAHTLLNESDWQSERSAQSLTHFPRAELAQMGRHYAILPLFRVWMDQETEAWRALSVLRRAPREIPASDVLRLREALATVQWTETLMVLNAGRQIRLARQLGIAEPVPDKVRAEKFCTLDEEAYMQFVRSLEPVR